MSRITELLERRRKLIEDARAAVATADKENRSPTAEENAQFDKIWADVSTLEKRIDQEEKLVKEEERARTAVSRSAHPDLEKAGSPAGTKEEAKELHKRAFEAFLRSAGFRYANAEERALSASIPTEGGYITTPEQFVNELLKQVDDLAQIRQVARVFRLTSAQSLGVPTLDTRMSAPQWTAEIGSANEDAAMAFGKRALNPTPLSKLIRVSNTLLRAAVQPVSEMINGEMAYQFAAAEENGFVTGTGTAQPLGLFTATSEGISTNRDEATDNTTSAPTFDGLINAKYKLKEVYRRKARWMFHRDAVKLLAKQKAATTGDYYWQPSVQEGQPDRILGIPVIASEYVPNTFTTGKYVGIIGDFSFYWIAEAQNLQMQVLNELYATTNQTGFLGRMMVDGMPVLEEAFCRVKLA